MTVGTTDVRHYLNDITVDRISDETLQGAIDDATLEVNNMKKSAATTAQVDYAIKTKAGYFAFGTYVDQYRNEVSSTTDANGFPVQMNGTPIDASVGTSLDKKLEHLEKRMKKAESIVTGGPSSGRAAVAGLGPSHDGITEDRY